MTIIGASDTVRKSRTTSDQLSTIVGCTTFSELVLASAGLHPMELFALLKEFDEQDFVLRRHAQMLIDDAMTFEAGSGHPQGSGLALPHPMDYEWRFTVETAEELLAAAVSTTKPGDTILLMGVPSVVVAAIRSSYERRFSVVGEANVISKGLRILTAGDERFDHGNQAGGFAAAILDPPWYPDQYCNMLADAASCCAIGAYLFVSAPSKNVRPSIPGDLELIDLTAVQSGLQLVSRNEGKLKYRTPFFEMNALRAAGIGAWLPSWRRGEERRYHKVARGQPRPSGLPRRSGFELTLHGIRIRLLASDGAGAAELVPLSPGEIFPSVSMRAPNRSEAMLWTSGNRAFKVDHDACLAALTTIAIDRRLLPKGLSQKLSWAKKPDGVDRVTPLIQNLLGVVDREFAEAEKILGPDAWETTANDARFLKGYHKSSP